MKKAKKPNNLKGKLTFVVLGVAALIALSGAVLYATPAGDRFFRGPEQVFEKAFLKSARFKNESFKQDSVPGAPNSVYEADAYLTDTGELRADFNLKCTADANEFGQLKVDVDLRQINEKAYMKFNDIGLSRLAGAEKQAYQDTIRPMLNKWVVNRNPDYIFLSHKDNGFYPGLIGVASSSIEPQVILDAFKKNNTHTIVRSKIEGSGDNRNYVMTIKVSKDAYDASLKSLKSDYKYRDEILEALFQDEDSLEIETAIRIRDGEVLWYTYKQKNKLCIDFVKSFGADVSDLPESVTIKSESQADDSVKDLKAPEGAITEQEFADILASIGG